MATMNTVHEGQRADSSVPYIASSRYYGAPLPAFTEHWLNMSSPREICSVSDKLFNTKLMMKLQMDDEPMSPNANLMERRRTGAHPLDCLGDGGAPEIGHARGRLRFAGTNFLTQHSNHRHPCGGRSECHYIVTQQSCHALFYYNKLSLALVLPYTLNEQNQHTATQQCDYSASRHSGF